ncbi:MAG: hypothetical protein ACP5I4_10775 [Oceanipulchritudo sp.]|jgi:hypothetical protein
MKRADTTVKLDGSLVEEVASDLEPGETLTAYVRKAVQYRVQRSRMRKAAEAYCKAAQADPTLADELETWEQADLAKAPQETTKASSR